MRSSSCQLVALFPSQSEAQLVHIRRRFNELVDTSGHLPPASLLVFVMRCGLMLPPEEVADFASRWGGASLTWGQVFPWIDERRRQAEGEHPFSRDGSHPANVHEVGFSGLSRAGFVNAMKEHAVALCPPSPLCACGACGKCDY